MTQPTHRRHVLLNHTHLMADITDLVGGLNLTDLADVTLTSPAAGQVLVYNGSVWVNGAAGYPAQLGYAGIL